MGLDTVDYYAVLDVAPQATQSDIYSAYQKAQQTYSLENPNIFQIFSEDEAIAWLDLVEEAYSVIGSPNSRRQYDLEKQGLFQPNLPSFELQTKKEKTQSDNSQQTDSKVLPEGFGQTKLSQYPVNKSMEDLIQKQDVFDGLFLKKIREYKKIELKEFSSSTCIAIRHLYAIENNNFSVLPAPVFVRGYIIQYCRILDLDEQKVVPSFMSLLKDEN